MILVVGDKLTNTDPSHFVPSVPLGEPDSTSNVVLYECVFVRTMSKICIKEVC